MTFVNISGAGLYFTCCHREVRPGETFYVPWLEGKNDRGLRTAMRAGVLAWRPGKDEPEVPGSPAMPDLKAAAKANADAKAKADAERAKKVREQQARDDAGIAANMAKMGDFAVPDTSPRKTGAKARQVEKPVTDADIIKGRPQSLEAIKRHNRAVHKA